MDDPFSALRKSLRSVFQFEAKRNGKYIYPPVQHLEDALVHYNPSAKNSFISLLRTIKEAMPYIEKWRVHFDTVKKSMDALATEHHMNINWNLMLSHAKVSAKFQFSALNYRKKEDDLYLWLTNKVKKPFDQMTPAKQVDTLIHFKDRRGFSHRLKVHLKKEPHFLYDLMIHSLENFEKISKTVLICQLTDIQLAKAIVKHAPQLVDKQKEPFEQVEQVINILNNILSHGRSVSTVLRTAGTVPILMKSELFQIALSNEYKEWQEKPTVTTLSP